MISQRTKAALGAAKARGQTLGNPRLAEAREAAGEARKAAADKRAANVLPIISQLQAAGVKSYRALAESLNARGIPAPRGGLWQPTTVRNIMARA